MENISAVIVVKNNPPFLSKVIDSVYDLVYEIVIVDIGISLQLIEVLKKYKKVKIIKLNQEVPYVELIRNKTKDFVQSDYLFFLDPDEIVTTGLKTIIKSHLLTYDYFRIPRKNIILGKELRHGGWWPDYVKRFYKKFYPRWQYPILRILLKVGSLARMLFLGIIEGRESGKIYVKAFRSARRRFYRHAKLLSQRT